MISGVNKKRNKDDELFCASLVFWKIDFKEVATLHVSKLIKMLQSQYFIVFWLCLVLQNQQWRHSPNSSGLGVK